MSSSLSHSTNAILPNIIEEHAPVAQDLYRQIEQLQLQITVTNERNQHVEHELVTMRTTNKELLSLSDKQSTLIHALESKLSLAVDIKRELQQLELERHDMEDTLQVVRDLALKQDKDTASALKELVDIRQQQQQQQQQQDTRANTHNSSLDQQRTRALENRVEELDNYIEEIQTYHQKDTETRRHDALQLQSAKVTALEGKIHSLEDELSAHQAAIRDGDRSGMIASLQDRILQLQQEKMAVEDDFETSYEAVVKENDTLTRLANQQSYQIQQLQTALADSHQQLGQQHSIKQAYDALKKEHELMEKMNQELVAVNKQPSVVYRKRRTPNRISVDEKPQLMSWVQEKLDTSCTMDVLQKVSHLADENMQLALWVDDLETQLMSQRHHLSQQVKTLECDVMNLTVLNNQLERQIEVPLRFSRSSAATATTSSSTHRIIRRDDTPASDRSVVKYRSIGGTPHVPPPTEPPNQPLPPTPPVSEQYDTQRESYRIKLEMVETQLRAHQERIEKLISDMDIKQDQYTLIQKELDLERRQRQKAEQAHAILEKRLQEQ
ncbi:hypothetical protein PS6_009456 [Mucor atramentarius]